MQFFLLLMQIIEYLPGIIKLVEQLFGPASGQGPKKLETAVKIIAAVAPAVGQSIAGAPENQGRLETLIGAVVAGLNASGKISEPPQFPPPDSGA